MVCGGGALDKAENGGRRERYHYVNGEWIPTPPPLRSWLPGEVNRAIRKWAFRPAVTERWGRRATSRRSGKSSTGDGTVELSHRVRKERSKIGISVRSGAKLVCGSSALDKSENVSRKVRYPYVNWELILPAPPLHSWIPGEVGSMSKCGKNCPIKHQFNILGIKQSSWISRSRNWGNITPNRC